MSSLNSIPFDALYHKIKKIQQVLNNSAVKDVIYYFPETIKNG